MQEAPYWLADVDGADLDLGCLQRIAPINLDEMSTNMQIVPSRIKTNERGLNCDRGTKPDY